METNERLQKLVNQLSYEFGINQYVDLELWDKDEIKRSLEDLQDLCFNIIEEL